MSFRSQENHIWTLSQLRFNWYLQIHTPFHGRQKHYLSLLIRRCFNRDCFVTADIASTNHQWIWLHVLSNEVGARAANSRSCLHGRLPWTETKSKRSSFLENANCGVRTDLSECQAMWHVTSSLMVLLCSLRHWQEKQEDKNVPIKPGGGEGKEKKKERRQNRHGSLASLRGKWTPFFLFLNAILRACPLVTITVENNASSIHFLPGNKQNWLVPAVRNHSCVGMTMEY